MITIKISPAIFIEKICAKAVYIDDTLAKIRQDAIAKEILHQDKWKRWTFGLVGDTSQETLERIVDDSSDDIHRWYHFQKEALEFQKRRFDNLYVMAELAICGKWDYIEVSDKDVWWITDCPTVDWKVLAIV